MGKNPANWASATRDVCIKLIATGQLPLGGLIAIILLALWKTPDDQFGEVWVTLRTLIEWSGGFGYLLAVAIGAAWFLHSRRFRRICDGEIARLAAGRTEEQQQYFEKKLPSSGG